MSSNAIGGETLAALRQRFRSEPKNVLAMNAATRQDFVNLVYRRDIPVDPLHVFSHKVDAENKAANQKSSGRCWIFAALNVLRQQLVKKYKLEPDFEMSQAYLFWCDKLEKANYFLEVVLATLEEETDGRLLQFLLRAPVQDGGQWDMLVALVEKYGLMPKSVYPESHHSGNSSQLNWLLTSRLREFAWRLRAMHREGRPLQHLQETRKEMLVEIHRILTIVLGEPPTTFDWSFRDKDKEYKTFRGLTPLSFASEHTDAKAYSDGVSLIHDPRNEYYRLYTVQYLGNVVGGRPVLYVNLPVESLKEYAMASIKAGKSVWFGCDIGRFTHRQSGVMNMRIFDYELAFGIQHGLSKSDRLHYGESAMTHAMVLTGVNVGADDKPTHWRVENSWGDDHGDKGYLSMSDDWFDQYTYQVVIERSLLPEKVLEVLKQAPIVLPPWDPMGALAV